METFKLERWFAKYEFTASHLLCSSDCESLTVSELVTEEGEKKGLEELWLGYTETLGAPALREEIAKIYQDLGIEQVLVHAGAQEAIHNFSRAVLSSGDHAVVMFPCYQSLFECPKSAGATVSHWKLREDEEGGWHLDLKDLEHEIAQHPNTRCLFINSPHNPTGFVLSNEQLLGIVEVCRPKGIMVFSDEVYTQLEPKGVERQRPICDLYENGISLNVLSKSYGLAGLRIGWLATRNAELLRKVASYKDYVSICSSAPSEYLSTLALRKKEAILSRNRMIIAKNLEHLDEFFQRHQDLFVWKRPVAGCTAFVRLRKGNSLEFCEELVQKRGVLLLPSEMYDFGPNHFRLGLGRKNLKECLAHLEDYLLNRPPHA